MSYVIGFFVVLISGALRWLRGDPDPSATPIPQGIDCSALGDGLELTDEERRAEVAELEALYRGPAYAPGVKDIAAEGEEQ